MRKKGRRTQASLPYHWQKLMRELCFKLREIESQDFKLFEGNYNVEGVFYSRKNKKTFVFRSSYEWAFLYLIENDDRVINYHSEPLQIPYKYRGKNRVYWPDILVLYEDGSLHLHEIKPIRFVKHPQVLAKANAAVKFLKQNIPGAEFSFITEKEIFGVETNFNVLKQYVAS